MYSNLTKEQLIAHLEGKNCIIELQESTIEMYQSEYDFMLIRGLENENKKLKEAINDVLEAFEGVGVVNTYWIQKRLLEVKLDLETFKQQEQ